MSAEDIDKISHASSQAGEAASNCCEGDALIEESTRIEDADPQPESDETTGASPGTAQACTDLGLSSLASNIKRFNIKPPGQA